MDADGLPSVGPGINLAEVSSVSDLTAVFESVLCRVTTSGCVRVSDTIKQHNSLIIFPVGVKQSASSHSDCIVISQLLSRAEDIL